MKRITLGLVCVAAVALMPGNASAALALSIGPGLHRCDAMPLPGRQFFDLIFWETGTAENEGLFAYDLLLTVPQQQRHLIALDGAGRPDSFVLDVPSGATFTVAESTTDHVLINVSSNHDLADITTGKKAARIFYTLSSIGIPELLLTPRALLVFDTSSTVFGSGDPNRELNIAVDLSDTGVAACPEPGSFAVLGFAGLYALRRTRRT